MQIADLYELFTRERRYLRNVSPKTLEWYRYSFRPFAPHLQGVACDAQALRQALKTALLEMATSGLQPSSINDYVRALNAFLRWARDEGHLADLVRLDYLKAEEKVIPSFTPQQIGRLLAWKPKTFAEHRLAALIAVLLDCGMRISEALGLRRADVDLDNLLLKVRGKGGRERVVPMSLELRKVLYRFLRRHDHDLVFPTLQGNRCLPRNVLRDFHWLGNQVGISGVRMSPHTFRHHFALGYLRAGGNVFYLQRILGHATLEMTQKYVRSLGVEDLKAVHQRFSVLAGAGR